MPHPTAIKIDYWAVQEGVGSLERLLGIAEFEKALQSDYLARVQARPSDLGGGLYEFTVEILSNITLQDVAKLIADGVAFDLLKSGTRALVLRPFLSAFQKLRSLNAQRDVDIHEIRFLFNDAEVVITKICSNSIYEALGEIFKALARTYEQMRNGEGQLPFSIQIPVFQDPEQILCRFRTLLEVDETLTGISKNDYLNYWGVYYDFERTPRVFDVKRRLLIDSDFLSNDRYWQEWARERKRQESA